LRQGAAHGNQGSPGADVESRGELKKFLALLIPAANEHRDGKGQAGPFATFFFGSASDQGGSPNVRVYIGMMAPKGPNPEKAPRKPGVLAERIGRSRKRRSLHVNWTGQSIFRRVLPGPVDPDPQIVEKCNDLPFCGNSGAFFVDNVGSRILRFTYVILLKSSL
jgi:hypothetical protein